ncbi:MAG: DUF58 domain-containing protein [Methylobacterium sp.]|nr:DUF58 domain-containing protein [Methylobacterium sp.]MCA3604169.1 DUF58 domain-containing protein [Methylobacterium sp.]MCA3615494.1 DUF58 domain-containing protein [Methylobacterium sp.]MCA4910057.1 DUF58 domain-containing protein [Methylobacterium sp.]
MADLARALPRYGKSLPSGLEREAAALSSVLEHLTVEARQVAAQLTMGIHGRRRPGPGEEFWEFRAFVPGEAAHRIDWRRSARDDRLYVREREWESASSYSIWFDLSPSMHFVSSLAQKPKRDRAIVLGLALADMLVHAGERVALLGRTNPMASRQIIPRLAEALLRARGIEADAGGFPPDVPLRRQDRLVLIGDFILPVEDFAARLRAIAAKGVRGTIVMVRDPVEEEFPFVGEVEFEGLEAPDLWRVGEVGEVAGRYRERILAHRAEIRRIATRHGFSFLHHVTDRPPAEVLLMLAALIGGQVPALPRLTEGDVEEARP